MSQTPSFPGAPNPAAILYYGGLQLPYTGDENHRFSAIVMACAAGGVIALDVVVAKEPSDKLTI